MNHYNNNILAVVQSGSFQVSVVVSKQLLKAESKPLFNFTRMDFSNPTIRGSLNKFPDFFLYGHFYR